MTSSESLADYESIHEEGHRTIRKYTNHAQHPYAQRRSTQRPHHHPPAIVSNSSSRGDRVSGHTSLGKADTEFKYVGSIEQYGWKSGQVPLFLEWYPEKLDRRSNLKFFESGREYTVGRSPSCDIFFQNSEPDSGISAQHLKIKVLFLSFEYC